MLKRIISKINQIKERVSSVSTSEYFKGRHGIRDLKGRSRGSRHALIVEPNCFHAEVIPGLVHYLQILGYDVTVLWRESSGDAGVFVRFEEAKHPACYVMTTAQMGKVVRYFSSQFEVILISSLTTVIPGRFWGPFPEYGRFDDMLVSRLLMIEHDIDALGNMPRGKYYLTKEVFGMRDYAGTATPMLNPHYFGQFVKHYLHRHRKFISVGTIDRRYRNFEAVICAVESLARKGIKDFEILIVGRGGKAEDFEQRNSNGNFRFLGFASFPVLFDAVEEADFFLPLLDPDVPDHRRYLSGTTSGSRQLIFGFGKPAIIQREFARAFGLNEEDAIIYDSDQLLGAMERAMSMDCDTYGSLVANLERKATSIAEASLHNLRSAINRTR